MRCLAERVKDASVTVHTETRAIGAGLLVYVAFTSGDSIDGVKKMAHRLTHLRIFEDAEGKLNESVQDHALSLLIIPAFTLYADTAKSHRPSLNQALPFKDAAPLFDAFINALRAIMPVETGTFGADMTVESTNDGPVTVLLEEYHENMDE